MTTDKKVCPIMSRVQFVPFTESTQASGFIAAFTDCLTEKCAAWVPEQWTCSGAIGGACQDLDGEDCCTPKCKDFRKITLRKGFCKMIGEITS